jgi:hypothetical protein
VVNISWAAPEMYISLLHQGKGRFALEAHSWPARVDTGQGMSQFVLEAAQADQLFCKYIKVLN